MPKFDASLDSGALTTLAGLGALAYFTRDKKDKDKPKDKAAEALKEAAKPEEKPGPNKVINPSGGVTRYPEAAEPTPEPQSKTPISSKVATNKNVAGGLKPYPLKTPLNEDKPSKPFPTELAAKNKAAAEAKSKPAATAKTTTASTKPIGTRYGDKDRSLLDMARGRKNAYDKSLESQVVSKKQGGSVRSTASKRGDGIAKRGFTRA